jgi:hypothetical protein
VYKNSIDLAPHFADTLTKRDVATQSFWPTIANFGLPYNLLVLAKVDAARARVLELELGAAWATEGMGALQATGLLYEIDMSILASLEPITALDGTVRFTPGTVTVLKQDPTTKALHAHRDHGCDDGRPPATCLHRRRQRVVLRASGGQDVDHGLGHLAGTRLSLAHRHGRDADDDVQRASRRTQALRAVGTAVTVAHRLRFRPPHALVEPDLATHAGAGLLVAPRAARQVRERPQILR